MMVVIRWVSGMEMLHFVQVNKLAISWFTVKLYIQPFSY